MCVGDRNLPHFLGLCLTSILLFVVQMAFAIYTGVTATLGTGEIVGIVLLSALPLTMTIVLISTTGYLLYWRWWLGMSTYEVMMKKWSEAHDAEMAKESQRLEKTREDVAREQERVRAEWLANREKERQAKKQSTMSVV
jgi:hypothetical protein